jgi:hypothetical protein
MTRIFTGRRCRRVGPVRDEHGGEYPAQNEGILGPTNNQVCPACLKLFLSDSLPGRVVYVHVGITDRACSLVKNHSLFCCISLFKRFLLHLQHCRSRIFEGTLRRQYVLPVSQGSLMVLAKPDIVRTGHFQLCVQKRDAICVSRFKGGPNWECGIWGEVMRPEDARLHPALGVDHRQIIWARHQALR